MNGLKIQWGYINQSYDAGVSVPLSINYTGDETYTAIVTAGNQGDDGSGWSYPVFSYHKRTNGFEVTSKSSMAGSKISWITIGY